MTHLYPKMPIYETFDKERKVHDFGKQFLLIWQHSSSFNVYVTQNINAISMVIPTFWDSSMSILLSISINVSFSSQNSC